MKFSFRSTLSEGLKKSKQFLEKTADDFEKIVNKFFWVIALTLAIFIFAGVAITVFKNTTRPPLIFDDF